MSDNNYLKDLVLLRNDPSKVPAILEAALRGEGDAQYAMGRVSSLSIRIRTAGS